MAKHKTPTKEFGDSLKYDPQFKGPLSKRSCTDVICLLIFIVFLGAWVAVGVYAFKFGDPGRLLNPTDSMGRRCGLDEEVRNKPYLLFFDISKCRGPDVILKGCQTPQVCVEKCPDTAFFINMKQGEAIENIRKQIICKDDKINGLIQNYADAVNKATKTFECTQYYLPSSPELGRCLPGQLSEIIQLNLTEISLTILDIQEGVTGLNIISEAKEMGHKIVQDLHDSWPFIVGGLGVAMVACLLYILLMRWFAGLMVWLSLLGVIALLVYCCYASYVKYDELKKAEQKASETTVTMNSRSARVIDLTPLKDQLDQILAMKDTWLAILIISAVVLVIVLLLVLFLRSRIRIAVALIKEASKAVGSITSTLFFPLFPWLMQLCVIGWFVAVLLFLAGSTKPVYRVSLQNCSSTSCSAGDICDPATFTSCSGCLDASCQFVKYEKEAYVNYLHAYNVFGVFWALFFVSALGEMILAATFATWYWTFNKSDVPFFTLTVSITRTFRYHLGTVAFGSLILSICRIIRVILEYINHKLSKYDNAFVKCCMCCMRCFFWCLEKFIKFINRNAYIMCAIHGKNFCRSAKDAFNLLMRNVIRVFVLDKVTDFLLFLGKLLITAGMCALSFFIFTKEISYVNEIPMLNYSIVPVLIIGFCTYFIAGIFFGVYSMAVDTLFLCFLEDCERNDGSQEKPYYMSKELMKILHKKNK